MQQDGLATMAKTKPKKRGVKPGTKQGPYKKGKRKNKIITGLEEVVKAYAPKTPLTLCGQLEDSILLLEQRISNAIAKINSLM